MKVYACENYRSQHRGFTVLQGRQQMRFALTSFPLRAWPRNISRNFRGTSQEDCLRGRQSMIQVRYSFVIFLVAIFVITFGSGCSSSNKPLSISPSSVALAPSQTVQFQLSDRNKKVTWSAGGVAGGNATTGTIDANGNYTAPSANTSTKVMITAAVGKDAPASAQVMIVPPGTVAPTANPQVALYTITPPDDASVTIQFGQTTNYGLTTWSQPTPTGGGSVAIFVAGMLANTPYHMQATVQFTGGLTFTHIIQPF